MSHHRRQHIVPGLGFRITSSGFLRGEDVDCGDKDRLFRFAAGVRTGSNYTEACYNLKEVFD